MPRARLPENAELDMVPIMSLIVHLIPMLLLCVRFTMLAQIPTSSNLLPSQPAASTEAFDAQEQKVVSVRITPAGFEVGGLGEAEAIPCTAAGCAPEAYDYPRLTAAMADAKRLHPTENRVVIAPEREVPYEVVVRVMAATREQVVGQRHDPLFPDALLAGATEAAP